MADDGFSVWGAEDDPVAGPSSFATKNGGQTSKKPNASSLFDDLGDAGWGTPDQSAQQDQTPSANNDLRRAQIDDLDLARNTERDLAIDGIEEQQPEAWTESIDDAKEVETIQHSSAAFDDSAGFDDFKDGQDGIAAGNGDADDDFGDFGEADDLRPDEADFGTTEDDHHQMVGNNRVAAAWRPLEIKSDSDLASLSRDIREILSLPMADGRTYPFHDGAASRLTQDNIRQVEGPAQVLVREESRQVWNAISGQPSLKPVDWMRSKTRRQFLIAMGVPINLDELNTTSSDGKPLPPLAVKLEKNGSTSHDDGRDATLGGGKPSKGREGSKPPEMDMDRAKDILALSEDQLTLLSLPALRDLSRELDSLTRQASSVLTHYLAQREAHAADAETYNGLIRDLVTGAAKRVSAHNAGVGGSGGGKAASRHASIRRDGPLNSGRSSPAVGGGAAGRSGSPRV